MLKAEHITVQYGSLKVVDGVSFTLSPGMWLMLCGPNGAGKSTLVGAVAQTTRYSGSVTLAGRNARSYSPAEYARKVGVLSQKNTVGYAFSVEEVVALGRYAHRKGLFSRTDDGDQAMIDAALEAAGLEDMRHQNVLTLSGGELQRTFLAQALCQNPQILILDEPANHLDLSFQEKLFELIGDWLRQPGRAVISVVHDLSMARKFGTHALLMHRGQAVSSGPIRQVLTRTNLETVYGMDVYAWMQAMLSQWEE